MSEGFLIEVAQNECRALYKNQFPDILLSLGCGKPTPPSVPSIASNDTKKTKASTMTNRGIESVDRRSYITVDSTDAYAQYPRPNFISLNPVLGHVPELDDVSSLHALQSLIQNTIDTDVVKTIVAQLFATLFYAETSTPIQDTPAGEILVPSQS
jgi:hypothetical protein